MVNGFYVDIVNGSSVNKSKPEQLLYFNILDAMYIVNSKMTILQKRYDKRVYPFTKT